MHGEAALVATVAAGLGLAFVFGFLAFRLRLPPLVGYLLAGVVVGPFTPGFVADTGLAPQLAEIGVILLVFGVGLHFSPKDLMAARGIAIPGALAQIAVATILGALLARFWGWSWSSGLVFGLSLSVASTVVLLRALEDQGALDSPTGRIAVGWLIVEDLVTVIVLVLLPALSAPAESGSGGPGILATIGWTLAKVVAFLALMLVVGRRAVPWFLQRLVRAGSVLRRRRHRRVRPEQPRRGPGPPPAGRVLRCSSSWPSGCCSTRPSSSGSPSRFWPSSRSSSRERRWPPS